MHDCLIEPVVNWIEKISSKQNPNKYTKLSNYGEHILSDVRIEQNKF